MKEILKDIPKLVQKDKTETWSKNVRIVRPGEKGFRIYTLDSEVEKTRAFSYAKGLAIGATSMLFIAAVSYSLGKFSKK